MELIMQNKHLVLIAAFFTVAIFSPFLIAQDDSDQLNDLVDKLRELQPPTWTYSDLTEKADIVVIAKLGSKSTAKRDNEVAGKFAIDSTILVKNRLEILSTLKGKVDDEIDVYTLKWRPKVIVLKNYDFAEFRSKQLISINVPVVTEGEITGYAHAIGGNKTETVEPEYLVFLQKLTGGGYAPITGQRYSGLSVKILK